jgi:hypothetical protein
MRYCSFRFLDKDRAIAQAVSRWLPTAAARVREKVRSCGICAGQSGTGADFLRVLRFPLPIFIPPIAPQSPSSIIWGWYSRPVVAAVPSGLSLTRFLDKAKCTRNKTKLCRTWGPHSGSYEEFYLLGYNVVHSVERRRDFNGLSADCTALCLWRQKSSN